MLEMAEYVAQKRAMRVPTGQLNSLIQDATMMKQPPSDKGKRLKIYYATQVAVKPPLFSFQINKRDLMIRSYARYLENKIREGFGFRRHFYKIRIQRERRKGRIAMSVIKFVIWVTAAYFIGNISPSILLGKAKGVDIKKEGSGNAGTTNALRVLGKKDCRSRRLLIIDVCKGVMAVYPGNETR